MLQHFLREAGGFSKLSMLVAIVPLVVGVIYAIRPSERRLALVRALSLASIFSGLSASLTGLGNVLHAIAATEPLAAANPLRVSLGLSEALAPMVVAFGCLTVTWLCVALGLRREA